jgi:hypothetical protein
MKRVILLQILLLVSVTSAATDPNLVGWWKFDEGNGTIAYDSAGSNNGTIYGATWAAGKIGGGMSFDGVNDYINVPDNPALRFTQNSSFTLCSWINPISAADQGIILGKWQTSGSYDLFTYNMDWWFSSKSIGFGISQSGIAYVEMGAPADAAPAGIWSHVACVYDNGNMKIYINGELEASGYFPYETGTNTANKDLGIGAGLIGSGIERYFGGTLDDIRIYSRALSAEEIQQLYEGTTPTLTGLEIVGPPEVAEESGASYKAIAQYDNGTTKDVTALADWRVEPNVVADINGGHLITRQVLYPRQSIKIFAEYAEGQTDLSAQKQVSVFAICPHGNALMFDGVNDYVNVADSASLRFTQNDSFSITAWVRPVSSGYFISKMQGTNLHNIFGYSAAWFTNRFWFVAEQSGVMNTVLETPVGSATAGSWYHVTCVYQNKAMNIYLNGQLSATGTFSGNTGITSPDKNLSIGLRSYGSTHDLPFAGTLDDIRIYKRALSTEEIQTIMHLQPIGSEPNLVAYWDFDEGMGQTLADVSGHGNNGVLGNSTGIDIADPCWVESEAPVGRCTTEQVLLRDLLGATDNKELAGRLIDDAKAKERASVNLITELQREMNNRDKIKATMAKVQINVAIIQEDIASRQIDATLERLRNALRLLDYVIEPPLPIPDKPPGPKK